MRSPSPIGAAPRSVRWPRGRPHAEEPAYEETIEVTVQGESEAEHRDQSAEAVQVVETESHPARGRGPGRGPGADRRGRGAPLGRARQPHASVARGLTDEQIRFFVDGIPLELAGFGPGSQCPCEPDRSASRSTRASCPIRFGADALGGAAAPRHRSGCAGDGRRGLLRARAPSNPPAHGGGRHLHEPSRSARPATWLPGLARGTTTPSTSRPPTRRAASSSRACIASTMAIGPRAAESKRASWSGRGPSRCSSRLREPAPTRTSSTTSPWTCRTAR